MELLTTLMQRVSATTFAFKATLLVAATLLFSCAAITPPLSTGTTSKEALGLRPLFADPDGLHLRAHAADASAGDTLQLWRREGELSWQLLQETDLNEESATSLRKSQLQFRDVLPDEPLQLAYRLRLQKATGTRTSASLEVLWQGFLPLPDAVADYDEQARGVVIYWSDETGFGARILRRDVLAETPFEALAIVDAAAGHFIDTTARPGSVYAYRVQLVDQRQVIPRRSPFSEDIYVALPD